MEVILKNISKHFYYTWIFKNVNYTFESGKWYAVTGRNGSGKSTLLQVISGFLTPSKGKIEYETSEGFILTENIYKHLTLTTPHLDLLEEFTLKEHIEFQNQFKPLREGLSTEKILEITGLYQHRNKAIKYFSSGMVQRLRLALAFFFDSSLLLLDEPTSHLDRNGIEWYKEVLTKYGKDRCVIISSNVKEEYELCPNVLNIEEYR